MMAPLLLLLALFQSPQDIYKAATADVDAGRYAEAAAKFEQILKDDPTHIPSEFNLAVCYSKLGDNQNAERLYRKIIEQDPEVYEAHINLGILLFNGNNDTAAADEQFSKAGSLRPNDSLPILYHARILEKRGDFSEAAKNYEHAIQLDPGNAEARVAAGLVDVRLKKADQAYAHLKAVEQRSDSANNELRRQLGSLYREVKQYDKAIEVLTPLGLDRSVELAITYFEKKDFAKAAALFDLLAAKEPANTDYLYMLGKAQMESKQYARAIAALQTVLKAKPNDTEALSTLASTYQLQEDWAHAVPVIERFIQLKPKDAFAYFMLGSSYDRLGNFRQALLNYNKFLTLDDGSSDVRSFQARQRAKTLERRLKK